MKFLRESLIRGFSVEIILPFTIEISGKNLNVWKEFSAELYDFTRVLYKI
ncbi:hypothetical protein LEP1GSC060_1933 [Leptospira weilii serovar Ranarum str. ICFT]|uniref:Uncharacterized protein n=1 Tax=Leptospira weilii serovar Ranarum str. ICFT TaxID=1218598 RepID=N1WFE6_9LEPT|nr:hypothetical protein LEP1GSC060_1933 [Leptospira weilii serovar Ranarum str. ICFT]